MTTPRPLRSPKSPTVHRSIGSALAFALLFPALSSSAEPVGPLGEADVIRLAKERSPEGRVAQTTDALADARARTAGLFANPSLSWSRETVESGPVGSQDIVAASLPIDIARPLATRSLARADSAWMRAEASLSRSDAVLDALLAYYDVVLAEQRVQILTQSVTNLEEAARVLARREGAGTASGYESTRLAVASQLSRSHLAEAQGVLESAKVVLALRLGVSADSLRVSSSTELMSLERELALLESGGASREVLEHARNSERMAEEADRRAGWAWFPTLEVGGGLKHVSEQGGGNGYVVGVALGLPLFDHGQALRAEAEALRALQAARAEALSRAIGAELKGAHAVFRVARQELTRFDAETGTQVDTLLAAAQSGYREGERTIVELLDAQRAQTEVAERRSSLFASAKRAEARLRVAAGDLQ